jgi:two-component system, OmpR family, alkaline phosphatase synthesis response regulator PhoP
MAIKSDILLVDDDVDLRDSLRIILESHDYGVRTASGTLEALTAIEAKVPDIVILDVMMSTDSEGFDLAEAIRNRPGLQSVPIILLTGFLEKVRDEGPGRFQYILGREWPANWLFEKPVDTKRLLAKIEGILRGKG